MLQGQKHVKIEDEDNSDIQVNAPQPSKKRVSIGTATKRRCVSTACIACRRRKSKASCRLPFYGFDCSVFSSYNVFSLLLTRRSTAVRWKHTFLCRLFIGLWNGMCLRSEFGSSSKRSIQKGHWQSKNPLFDPTNPYTSNLEWSRR